MHAFNCFLALFTDPCHSKKNKCRLDY